MAAKTGYSAGTVFLQVVPSYKNFMTKLQKDLNGPLRKAMEDETSRMMEKAGIEGGEKYADGVTKGVNKAAKRGRFAADAMKALEKAMADLGKDHHMHDLMKTMHEDFKTGRGDANELADELHELRGVLRDIGRTDSDIEIRTNADAAARSLDRAADAGRSFARQSESATRAAKSLGDENRRGARAAEDNDKAIGGLRARMGGLLSGTNDAANSFRFFNFAVLAAATVGPALIPILAGIAGGLAALVPAALSAGAAMGVAGLALSGISGAVQALGAVQKSGGRDAASYARAQVSAARQVADARRSLADARRSAAEGVRRALEAERQAEMRLADAQRDAKRAQQELTQARKEAKQELMDLADQVAQNQLDERQGVIDLFNAYTQYGATMADGGATNLEKEQADVNLKQAELSLKRIRDEQKRLAEQKAKTDKAGINGTNTMIRAQDRVTEAVAREKEARLDLREASRGVDQARADGARRVADAQRNLNRALQDQKLAAQQTSAAVDNLNEAMKNLSPAQRKFARFIFGLREGIYELRAIAAKDFLPGLQRAMERIMKVYGPGFKDFVGRMSTSLGQLSEDWANSFTSRPWRAFFKDFGDSSIKMNEQMARGFMGFGEGFAVIFREAIPLAQQFTGWLERIGKRFSEWAQSKSGRKDIREFFEYVSRIAPKIGDFFGSLFRFLGALGKALAPIGETILTGLTRFLDHVSKMDPGVLRVLAGGIIAVVAALQISTGLVAFGSIIGIIAGSPVLAAIVAVTALAGALLLFSGGGDKAGGAAGRLMKALKPTLTIFKELGSYIGGKFKELWNDLKPGLDSLAKVITKDLLPAFERFWPVIKPVVHFLIDVFFGVLKGAINGIIDIVGGVLTVLSGLMDFITGVFTGNWRLAWDGIKKIFSGIFRALWGIVQLWIFGRIFGGLKSIFGKRIPALLKRAGTFFKNLLLNPFKYFWKWLSGFVSGVIKGFGRMKDGAGKAFKAIGDFIKSKMGKPIVWVVDLVLNKGIIAGVNKLLGWLNIGKIGTVSLPKFATGGVVGGYAPGVDRVHAVLSPGEGILRPEVVRAMGSQWVQGVNAAAIRGGVGGVQTALGLKKFATGGVVMPVKGSRSWTTYPGHTGIDFPRASGTGVYAATAGRVTSAPRWGYSYGHHINLQGGGKRQIYAHLSAILAKVGAIVAKGQQIGKVGSTGNSTGPHLHFEVRPGGTTGSAAAFLRGAGAPSGKSLPSIWDKLGSGAIKALANPIGFLKGMIPSSVKGATGGIASLVKQIPEKLFGKIFDWIKTRGMKALGVTGKFFGSTASKISDVFGFLGIGGRGGPGSPTLYDQGGYLPPGYSTVLNKTGRPEPVLTGPQWDKIMAGKGGDTYINVPVKTDADPDEIAEAINKAIKRAGRRR